MFDRSTRKLGRQLIQSEQKGAWHSSKWIVMLHGQGDVKESYRPLLQEINLTGLNGLLLDAPIRLRDPSFSAGHFWYSMDPNDAAQTNADVLEAVELVVEAISELKELGSAMEDIFLFGFSAGGRIALNTALALERRSITLGGVLLLSPRFLIHPQFKSGDQQGPTPWWVTHGVYDGVISVEETRRGVEEFKVGRSLEYKEYSIDHEICIEQIQDLRRWLTERM
jgi:phospholipase/carboxylesterase